MSTNQPPKSPNQSALTLEQSADLARAAFKAGDWDSARRLCQLMLAARPDFSDALGLLGLIALQNRRPDEAAVHFARAVAADPGDRFAHNNLGIALMRLNRAVEAVASYERALALDPRFAEAHFNRGNALKAMQRFEEALRSYESAVNCRPGYAEAINNRGLALQALARHEPALEEFDRALRSRPDYAGAHYNRGNALGTLRRLDEALASYDRALAIRPDYSEAYMNRGNTLKQLGRLDAALASYDRTLEIRPADADALNNRGVALHGLQRFEEALASYDRALNINPRHAEAYSNRGNALRELKRIEDALASYEQALRIRPEYAEALNNRGVALLSQRRTEEALACYRHALKIMPDYAEAHHNVGVALQLQGRFDAALESYGRALEIDPHYASAHAHRGSCLAMLKNWEAARESYARALELNEDCDWLIGNALLTDLQLCDWRKLDAQISALVSRIESAQKAAAPWPVLTLIDALPTQRLAAEIWTGANYPENPALGPVQTSRRPGKIRVGYFSADFHNHATAYLVAELFERHDRQRFELVAFSFGPDRCDEMRTRLAAAFDRFLEVRTQTDLEIARLSRELAVDIAVDLKGFTRDQRTGIFACRAAPIQVNYLGYPGTMAADFIDYIVADRVLIPPQSRRHFAEKIVYLPNSYQVNDRQRRIADRDFSRTELGLPAVGFVFCCFNNNYKISPATFAGWMRVLAQVEHSALWLLQYNSTAVVNLRSEAAARGVDPERLIFAPHMPQPEHLARYGAADLFLDTLPCNAHTTASDALWAGLPILTLAGESLAARVAASLLSAIGLPELIASSQSQYEALAIELALSPERLAAVRRKLQANRSSTPLFDTELFTRHLEVAYTQMVERKQANSPPDDIVVAP